MTLVFLDSVYYIYSVSLPVAVVSVRGMPTGDGADILVTGLDNHNGARKPPALLSLHMFHLNNVLLKNSGMLLHY